VQAAQLPIGSEISKWKPRVKCSVIVLQLACPKSLTELPRSTSGTSRRGLDYYVPRVYENQGSRAGQLCSPSFFRAFSSQSSSGSRPVPIMLFVTISSRQPSCVNQKLFLQDLFWRGIGGVAFEPHSKSWPSDRAVGLVPNRPSLLRSPDFERLEEKHGYRNA
jgi:hypothetical protein